MSDELAGRAALVTGASRGLGRALALALGAAGVDVLVACKNRLRQAREVRDAIRRQGRRSEIVALDLEIGANASRLVRRAHATFPELDLLVCNAGICLERLLLKTAEQDFDRVLRVNLTAPAMLCRHALPLLAARGGGDILLVSSFQGLTGGAGLAAYAASKAGVLGLTRSLAAEAAEHGIRVNAVCPGYMETDMTRSAGARAAEQARARSLLGRLADPAAVASFMVRLLQADGVSGQVFNLDSRLARWT